MKSIKEKSGDYVSNFHPSIQRMCKESFEAGANYVLEEIENVIKADRILGHPFPSLEMRYNQIISVIEQLKK